MTDVLVVGAGPTGLTLAAVLRRYGVDVRLIDRATTPPLDRSRAIVLQARTLELFERLGIVDEVLRLGLSTEGANLFAPSGRRGTITIRPEWVESRYGGLETLPQHETERLLGGLVERSGGAIESGAELVGLLQDDSGVDATLRHADGRTETARVAWVAGCDGAHSAVRHLAGIPFPGETYPNEALLGDVELAWDIPHDHVAICPRADGFLLSFPLPGARRFRVILILPHPAAGDDRQLGADEFLAALARMLPSGGATPRLLRVHTLARYRLHRRGVPRYREGRCFVAGDAAHIHSPVGGQGMNTGIQDAVNLGWKLGQVLRGDAPASLLETYDAERHRVGEYLLKNTDRAFAALAAGGPVARLVRRTFPVLGIRILGIPCVGRRIARLVSQTAIRYRRSALSSDGPTARALGRGAPRAGDRMPDVELEPGRWLAARTDLAHYTLLLFAGDSEARMERLAALAHEVEVRYETRIAPVLLATVPRPHRHALLDSHAHAHRRFGALAGGAYLVRPDGYIAWRDAECGADALWGAIAARLLGAPESRAKAGNGNVNRI